MYVYVVYIIYAYNSKHTHAHIHIYIYIYVYIYIYAVLVWIDGGRFGFLAPLKSQNSMGTKLNYIYGDWKYMIRLERTRHFCI